jgi:capsular exopolysaccharide synthesis family protein
VGEVTSLPRKIKRSSNQENGAHWELQLFEESIDGLRTYLSLVNSLQDMKVLAVASAISREGKTSLAAQLAISMATSTGEPTLLIDGDLRSPDIHRIFGIDRGPGVVEVLKNGVPVESAIDDSFSEQLHLLPAGRCESSPHRMVGNGKFAAMIKRLREKYRHIIIDTPPILAASEALVMARAADATILCVRRDFSRVDQVQDAYSRLQGAGVNTAGAVLNGVPSRQYAYRYGSYYFEQGSEGAQTSDEGVANS